MTEKYVSIDINDPRSTKIAEALSNPTSKKILNLLAERELSASDISNLLKQPLNTITYNLDKLIETGLIEKSKTFFWSAKGKKIPTYTLSNKKIMISPKTISKSILPALIGTTIVALGINYFSTTNSTTMGAASNQLSADYASGVALTATNEMAKFAPQYCPQQVIQTCASQPLWAYFILGALTLALIYLLWNSLSNKLKGGKLE